MKSFERGKGQKAQRSRKVVVGSKKQEIKGDVPTQIKLRVQKILSKLPNEHIHDLTVEFRHRDTDPMFQMHGMHGRYIKETKTLRLQPLKTLKNRTIYHEVGHHVYSRFLTGSERKLWEKISRDEADKKIPNWMPKAFRPEEYFAELYSSNYTKSALISPKFVPVEVKKFMDDVVKEV